MSTEAELRDQLATLTRIFAMRGLLGLHGHVSTYDPATGRMYMCPGMGSDKAMTRPEDLFVFDLQGKILEGEGRRIPLEWPIHSTLHAARPDVLAIAHLHSPYATAFAVTNREFRPVLLSGGLFADGVPIYPEQRLITTLELGQQVTELIAKGRAALLRSHGTVEAAGDLKELLYSSVLMEESARMAVEAAALGELDYLPRTDTTAIALDRLVGDRTQVVWDYFARLEARWDRQPPVGSSPLG
jgi:ribulose-5-phosphate 4-epimerase/fuculose-1-phosphate aldolase